MSILSRRRKPSRSAELGRVRALPHVKHGGYCTVTGARIGAGNYDPADPPYGIVYPDGSWLLFVNREALLVARTGIAA